MAATAIPIDTLPSINPATGEVLAHFERTAPALLPEIVSRARVTQGGWVKLPIREITRLNISLWNQAALSAQIPPDELPVMPRL